MPTPASKGPSSILSTDPKTAAFSSSPATAASTASAPSSSASASRRVPLDKRKRTETSCDKCKSRKQKCIKEPGQDACRYCILHKIECLTTQPRKKRLYGSVEGLSNRLALLESLVKGLLPEADVSNLEEMRQLGISLGISIPESANGPLNDSDQDNTTAGAPGLVQGTDTPGYDKDEPLSFKLLPDQQGQVQYIGPSSSFSFYLKLRSLCGQGTRREFVLFGRNPADANASTEDDDADPHTFSFPRTATATTATNSPALPGPGAPTSSETPAFDSLVEAYFAHINPDFPVLHEASFRVAYDSWLADNASADPAWLCSFLCMLLLARRVTRVTIPEDEEKRWWRRIQTLLPVVIFATSIVSVQALLLTAIHLHNTNHRDACWNLTGTAVRIAYAVGLHQENVNSAQTPLPRELRRRLWWTLYAFEQMQVSSYDRPSAIDQFGFKVNCPNAQILTSTEHHPPDYCKWFNRMIGHLSSTCRAPKSTKSSTTEELYAGPLSPAFGVKRDLERWQASLPQHLHMEALESSPPAFHRPILILHALYHYTVIVLCRAALLDRTTLLSREHIDSSNAALIEMADFCSESGKALARILLRLDRIQKLDVNLWWDSFYALSSGCVLVLDIVCVHYVGALSGGVVNDMNRANSEVPESRILLAQLADLAQRHRRNPQMPGTIEKFLSIVPELHAMADSAIQNMVISTATASTTGTAVAPAILTSTTSSTSMVEPHLQNQPQEALQHPHQHHQQQELEEDPSQMSHPHMSTTALNPFIFEQSTTNSGAFVFADTSGPLHLHSQPQHHPHNSSHPLETSARFFASTSTHPHADFTPHTTAVLGPSLHHHQPQPQHLSQTQFHTPQQQQQQPSHATDTAQFDRNMQMNFMDFPVKDWDWADLGNMLVSGPPPAVVGSTTGDVRGEADDDVDVDDSTGRGGGR